MGHGRERIFNMDSEFHELDVDALQALYQKEANRLNAELLEGASWDSVKEQKQKVVEIAIALHKKKYPLHFNPAEFASLRDEKGDNP